MLKRQCARIAVLFVVALGVSVFADAPAAQARGPIAASSVEADVAIAPADRSDALDQTNLPSGEPFGRQASEPVGGSLQNLWRSASSKLPRERSILTTCRLSVEKCPAAAVKFLSVINRAAEEDGWTRIAEVNRAINLDIRPVSDITQYGAANLWPTPLMAFASNAGDCKDYAIAKYVALSELGVSADDLRLIIVHIRNSKEDHAIVAVRLDGRWLILDNRTSELRYDTDVADYDPLFVIQGDDVKRLKISPPEMQAAALKATRPPAQAMLFAGPESFAPVA